MPGLVIKDLPNGLRRKLKEQAARHHRSMTKEVLAVLEQALGEDASEPPAEPPFKGHFSLTERFLERAKRTGRR
jgi:plasmid stability protein